MKRGHFTFINQCAVQTAAAAMCFSIFSLGIPAAPGRPVAQEASSSAVMVHWPPPASSAHCAVSSYTVEYRQEGMCGSSWNVFYNVQSVQVVYSVPARLVAVAAGGQQQRGVCSD